MEKIDNALDTVDDDVNNAKEMLHEGKKLLNERIKLIRLADRESWLVASEYMCDELAEDDEDEKHINRAIRSANSKFEKQKKRVDFRMKSQTGSFYNSPRWTPYNQVNNSNLQQNANSIKRCWTCNRVGHYSNTCFLRGNQNQAPTRVPQNNN